MSTQMTYDAAPFLSPGPKVMVAGGVKGDWSWQVITDPDRVANAALWHEETALHHIDRMEVEGKRYEVIRYTNGNGPVWLEIEYRS